MNQQHALPHALPTESSTTGACVMGRGVLPREGRDDDRDFSRVITRQMPSHSPSASHSLDRRGRVLAWWAYEGELKQRIALESVMRRMFELH